MLELLGALPSPAEDIDGKDKKKADKLNYERSQKLDRMCEEFNRKRIKEMEGQNGDCGAINEEVFKKDFVKVRKAKAPTSAMGTVRACFALWSSVCVCRAADVSMRALTVLRRLFSSCKALD